MCNCGCNTCKTKSTLLVLNESVAPKEILSEGLKYHIDNNRPLTDHLYRAGSESYFNLIAEARSLYSRGIIDVVGDDLEMLTETDLGHFGMFEGKKVPLDYPIEITEYSSEGEGWDDDEIEIERDGNTISVKISVGNEVRYKGHKGKVVKTEYDGVRVNFPTIGENGLTMHFYYEDLYSKEGYYQAVDESLNEAKNKKKKDNRKIGKPMRSSSGGKAYKVYVKDPKTKKIKTVRFGSGGLRAKINDKKARTAFAARHKCSQKKDKTKAGYWSCRLPRYAKLLGLKSSFSGFW